jgi:hypothetical protein
MQLSRNLAYMIAQLQTPQVKGKKTVPLRSLNLRERLVLDKTGIITNIVVNGVKQNLGRRRRK